MFSTFSLFLGLTGGIAIAYFWKIKINPFIAQFQERKKTTSDRSIVESSKEIDQLVEHINEFVDNSDNTKAIASITEGTATYEGVAKLYRAVRSLVESVNSLVLNLRVASQKADIPSDSLPPLFSETPSQEGSDRKKRKQ